MNEKAAAIQLVAMDLDNTLLRRDKMISDYAVSVLSRCQAAGILLAFATARSELASVRVTARLKPDLFISNGGALARWGETELFRACLEPQAVEGIVAGCLSASEVGLITLEGERGYFSSEPIDSAWADYAHSVYTDFANPPCFGAVFKIGVKAENDEVVRRIAQGLPGVGILAFSGDGFYLFKAERASKEAALEVATAALGLKMEQVAAFGDDWSDVGMLRAAGIGVAMRNAIPEAQSAADALCGDCDEDGLAIWIEQNILTARENG